jgi:rhamnogalacturonyl hydrolase YesR
MAPPFLAYYAVATSNASLLSQVVQLCGKYRQVLRANITGISEGTWEHIIGPPSQDTGLWSTGNGWAAAGMARVLAVVLKTPVVPSHTWRSTATATLTGYIKEIIDGAMSSPTNNGLLRNYLNDTTTDGHGFGETSGTSLLASVAYRMAVLSPSVFTGLYVRWADGLRGTLGNGKHVSTNGTVYPAVNPLDWYDTTPITYGSPEGNNFVVLMYAAWRDCVQAGICSR